jgi:hypothetical protein
VGLVEFGDGGLGVRVLIEFRIKWVWLNSEMMDRVLGRRWIYMGWS